MTTIGMDPKQVLEMITSNRKFIRLRSNIAMQNLAMLHKSFDGVEDDECHLALRLNDSYAAVIFGGNYLSAIDISLAALAVFNGSGYTALLAEHESLIGRSYTYLTQYETGMAHLKRAEELAFELSGTDDIKGLQADVLHNLAMNNHHATANDEVTVGYLDRALHILEDTSFSNRKGICYMGIGNVKIQQGKIEEALHYNIKAMEFFEEAETYTNLSNVYSNIGKCHMLMGCFEPAETYIMRGLDMRTRTGNYWEIANSYFSLAILHKRKGDNESAYQNLLISRDYAMVSQAVGVQRMVLEELESLAVIRGDEAAAEEHRLRLRQVDTMAA